MGDIMLDKYIESFKNLSDNDKKEVIIDEMIEVLNTIESIAKEKKIDINKLKSEHYIKYKSRLLDEDFHDLLFIYITYLKEDLAGLL